MALACGKMRNHVWGYARKAASLREAAFLALPPEERLAFGLGRFCLLGSA